MFQPVTLDLGDFSITGYSRAGVATCVTIPQLKICFDVAQGLPFAMKSKQFFITHTHQDHASGIPYITSIKALEGQKTPRFYIPETSVSAIEKILNLWGEIEGHQCPYDITPVKQDDIFPINDSWYVQAKRSCHRIPSYAYTVFQKKKRLTTEYANSSPKEIMQAKKDHKIIEEKYNLPILTFTGDTTINICTESPEILQSKNLIIECTYIDDKKTVNNSLKWGHIHLNQIVEQAHKFVNIQKLILIHFSRRYSKHEILKTLEEKMPPELFKKTLVLL